MALIALLADIRKDDRLTEFDGGFIDNEMPIYSQPTDIGIRCANPNCIVHDPMERQYTRNKFLLIRHAGAARHRLRCLYCESDIDEFVAVNGTKRKFLDEDEEISEAILHDLPNLLFFGNAADAHDNRPRRQNGAQEKRLNPP